VIRKLIRYIRTHRRLPTLRAFQRRRRVKMSLPDTLQIEPTVLCNFKCKHCPNSEINLKDKSKARHIELSLFKKIVDEVPTLKEIKLQGLGEPLLCPQLKEMMAYGHSKGIQFNIISNGTLVSSKLEEIMPFLTRFVISFDTLDQQKADKNKLGLNVERCKSDVREMVHLMQKVNPQCTVGITTVVTQESLDEIPEIMHFANEMGVDYAGFVAVENWSTPKEFSYSESCEYVAEARKVVSMDKIRALYDERGYTFQLGIQDFSPRKSNCYWMFDSAYITYDGYMTPCCLRPNHWVYNFGNVKESHFKDIWNGEKAREFRRTHLLRTPNELCDRCPL